MPEPSFEERRQKVLRAATRVFAQQGWAASNKEIAKEAGVTAAALYWYFPSKEELFWAVIREKAPDLSMMRNALLSMQDLPPRQVLPNLMGGLALAISNPETVPLFRILVQEAVRNPAVTKTFEEQFIGPVLDTVEEYIAYQISRGVFRPENPKVLLLCYFGPLLATNLLRNILQFERFQVIDMVETFTKAVHLFLDAVLVDREA